MRSDTPSRLPDDLRTAIVAAYKDGLSSSTVAAQFGVSAVTVQTYAKRAGISRRQGPDNMASKEEMSCAVGLYQSGLSSERIGRMMGRSPSSILSWVEKYGLPKRARWQRGPI